MENKYGLTFPQKNIWLVEEFFGKSPINTIVGMFKINKEFDFDMCEKAINKMVEINDALRLKIFKEDETIYQRKEKYNYFDVDYFDLSNEEEEKIKELEFSLITKPFEVIGNPLYYFAVIKKGEGSGYIFVKLHHLVSDAWTFGNVATQLAEYIDMFTDDKNEEIQKPSYIEFIESEKEYISSEKFSKDKIFWEEYLSGIEESVGLKENSNKTLVDAKRYTVRLDEALNSKIKEYCKLNKISPYTIFMNALAIYLHRVTEKYDFVIGTPVLNRSNFKEKKMMGMFVSTMPVRVKIDEKETFLEMCKKSASETMTLFRHQKYPYSLMLKDFREKNNVSCNLYEVMISYQNARAEYSDNEKYSTNWMFSTKVQDQFAIHIMDMDETGTLEVHFDYLVDLFEDIEIEYISKRLFTIIHDGITNNKTIETIEIMPEEEKNKILYEFNDTKTDYPRDKTIHELFSEITEKTPNKVAVVYEDKSLTYKELDDRSSKLGNLLRKNDVKPNDCVAIMIDKNIELMVGIIGILKSSAAYVPIDYTLPKERIDYMLENSNIKCIVTKRSIDSSKYNGIKIINIDFDEDFYNKESDIITNVNTPTDMAYVMYTSGTTGKPKGAKMTHRNVIKLNRNITYINIDLVENIFLGGNIVFDASMHEMWLTYLNGKTGYVIDKDTLMNPNKYLKLISNTDNNLVIFTTQLFNQYSKLDLDNFKNTRYIIAGGDVLLYEYANIVVDKCKNTRLINIYGPTECTAATTTYWVKNSTNKKIPIGKPINNTKCYIVDSKNRVCPLFVSGELYIGGEGVGLGYINNDEVTKKSFIDFKYDNVNDYIYKSGDVVKWDEKGNILFEGRKDRQIKIRGCRIELPEIENATLRYPGITQVNTKIVGKLQDKKINMYIVANEKIDINDLRAFLKDNIPLYMIPTGILQIDEMPLNPSGKVEQSKLPEIKEETKDSIKDIVLPETKIEKIIAEEIEKLIGKQIGIYDDIFNSGLDSIMVTKLIINLEKKDVFIKYSDVFKQRNIKEIAKIYDKEEKNKYMNEVNEYNYKIVDKVLNTEYDYQELGDNNIAITGTTGFLGVHFLKEFLVNKKGIAYCLVRDSDSKGNIRLKNRFINYFGEKEYEYFKNRIKVLNYDIATPEFLARFEDDIINYDIKAVVNVAAIVKHYGNEKEFYEVNVNGVERLINACSKTNIRFVQISTLSVSGNGIEGGITVQKLDNRTFNEKNLYVGQTIKNLYTYTKYMAEIKVLEAIDNGLKANIIRVGNLMGRITDGKFQINAEENGFVQRIKFILEKQIVSEQIYKTNYLEFSPVDETAKRILKLLDVKKSIPVFHLYNDNHIMVSEFIKVVGQLLNKKIKVLEDDAFIQKIKEINDSKYNVLLVDINEKNKLDYVSNIKITQEFTKKVLIELGLMWKNIDVDYLDKFLKEIGEKK